MNVLLTGATGLVGKALLTRLRKEFNTELLVRRKPSNSQTPYYLAEISKNARYYDALKGKDVVVHCAARVHVMNDKTSDPLKEYREVNVNGTLNLAEQAAELGVRKFIFISSIKVNGEHTDTVPFKASDDPRPSDPYGVSKYEAELALLELSRNTKMEVIIIRSPLVYGPGVKANFNSLIRLVVKGIPLPFGAISNNRRSMVYVENLSDFIITTMKHSKKSTGVYLVSDDNDISTKELIDGIAIGLRKNVINIPVPIFLFKLAGKITGKQAVISRLIGSLQVNIEPSKQFFSWSPPYTFEDGIKETTKPLKKKG